MAQDIRSKVILGMDVNEFRRGITQVDSSIKGISKQFQNLGGLIGATFVAGKIADFTKEAIKLGSEMEGVAQGFQRFGSEAELQGLRKATRGLVTDLELMKQTVMAGNFGIPVQELGQLLEFASRRAKETGQSVDYLVNSIVTGIGRKSTLILDNLGISAVRLKQEFNGAALEAQNIGDVTAAVSRIAAEELGKMGEPIDTATDKLLRLSTAWDNFLAKIGGPIAGEAANILEKFMDVIPTGEAGGLSRAIRGYDQMLGTGATMPSFADFSRTQAQGIFGAFPVAGAPVQTAEELAEIAKKRAEREAAVRKEYELQWEVMQNQISLYEQMQTQMEETFKSDLVAGFTSLQLEQIDMLEGEMVPILDKVKERFDTINFIGQQFGQIMNQSFTAALESGQSFFEVLSKALKAYVQQMVAAVAATTALAVISSAFTGGSFLSAFGKLGSSTGLASFFGGQETFEARVKGLDLILANGRANRTSSIINGN